MNTLDKAHSIIQKLKRLLWTETLIEAAILVMAITVDWEMAPLYTGVDEYVLKGNSFFDVFGTVNEIGGCIIVAIALIWIFVWKPERFERKKGFFMIPLVIQLFVYASVIIRNISGLYAAGGYILPMAYVHMLLSLFSLIWGIRILVYLKNEKMELKAIADADEVANGRNPDNRP